MYRSAQKPEPKAKAKGNDLKPRGKVSTCGSTCDAKQEAEKGIAGKPSTKVRREAWKQAERKMDKSPDVPTVRENPGRGKRRNRG